MALLSTNNNGAIATFRIPKPDFGWTAKDLTSLSDGFDLNNYTLPVIAGAHPSCTMRCNYPAGAAMAKYGGSNPSIYADTANSSWEPYISPIFGSPWPVSLNGTLFGSTWIVRMFCWSAANGITINNCVRIGNSCHIYKTGTPGFYAIKDDSSETQDSTSPDSTYQTLVTRIGPTNGFQSVIRHKVLGRYGTGEVNGLPTSIITPNGNADFSIGHPSGTGRPWRGYCAGVLGFLTTRIDELTDAQLEAAASKYFGY